MHDRRPPQAPVHVGDEVTIAIEGKGQQGDGIGKYEGFALFVAGTEEGDTVKVKVTKVFRKMGLAEIVSKEELREEEPAKESEHSAADKNTGGHGRPEPHSEERVTLDDSDNFGEE